MKLCKDCIHYDAGRCEHNSNLHSDYPDYEKGGRHKVTYKWQTAQAARIDSDTCGPDARFFEENLRA